MKGSVGMLGLFFFCATALGCCAPSDILPVKVFLVLARENMGCTIGEELVENAAAALQRRDGHTVTLTPGVSHEDAEERHEILLVFPADELIGQDGGYLVARLAARTAPAIRVDAARLIKSEGKRALTVDVYGPGTLTARLSHTREPLFRRLWQTCPAAGVLEPYQAELFMAYPLEAGFIAGETSLAKGRHGITLALNPLFTAEMKAIDHCQVLLGKMDAAFGAGSQPLLWERARIDAGKLRELAGEDFAVMLAPDTGESILVGPAGFVPHLRQRLAVREADGRLIGAEVRIRQEKG